MKDLAWIKSRRLGIALTLLGAVGWIAAFTLLTEYIHTLQDPSYDPSCNVSVLVTCGPNMASWQGSLFGFSNTILGVTGFVIPILVGIVLMTGAKLPRWFWIAMSVGHLAALSLVVWLFSQSVFVLGTLCPWCIVVWLVTIPLFFVVLTKSSKEVKPDSRITMFISDWFWVFIVIAYIALGFIAQVRLDWFAEFTR